MGRGWWMPLVVRAAFAALCAGFVAVLGADGGRVWAQAQPGGAVTPTPAAAATALAPATSVTTAGSPASGAPESATLPAAGATPEAGGTPSATATPEAGAGPAVPPPPVGASPPGGATVSTSAPGGDAATGVTPVPPVVATDAAAAPGTPPDAPPRVIVLPSGEATVGPGRVLYADSFASATSGWPVQASDPVTRRVGYANGEYYVARLPGSGGSPYVTREERFGDFLLEVDARLVEPTADAYVFVDFRRQESGEHYSFVVAPDEGAFIVRRNTDREGATVLDWTRAAAIQRGAAPNRLGVRAQGGDVALLVNGEEVGRARADDLREGGIGFGVGSLGDGPAEARFGNLVVTSVE